MFDDFSKYRVLREFFREPTTKQQIRGLSRKTELSTPSVKKRIEQLQQEDLIQKVDDGVYPGYKAKMNDNFKNLHRIDTVRRLYSTGLISDIRSSFHPDCIVLFGSAANGGDVEQSDIDLLVVAEEKEFDTESYEEDFNRVINLQFNSEEEIKSKDEFANSLANGIVLDGYLKVK